MSSGGRLHYSAAMSTADLVITPATITVATAAAAAAAITIRAIAVPITTAAVATLRSMYIAHCTIQAATARLIPSWHAPCRHPGAATIILRPGPTPLGAQQALQTLKGYVAALATGSVCSVAAHTTRHWALIADEAARWDSPRTGTTATWGTRTCAGTCRRPCWLLPCTLHGWTLPGCYRLCPRPLGSALLVAAMPLR